MSVNRKEVMVGDRKKNMIFSLAVSAIVMLALPWFAVTFVKSDALYSVSIGIFAGKDVRHLWSFPVVSTALFLVGAWIFFDIEEMAFLLYATVYLALGVVAMLISMFVRKKVE